MATSELLSRHCKEGAPAIPEDRIHELLKDVPGWTREGKSIKRDYSFPDFAQALAFVNQVGGLAESESHHPDFFLTWGRVDLTLSTHSAGGLSDNDFILAAKIDALEEQAAVEQTE
jgi:4a-hydroxytetrahydrobiopterin dehydratase